jgi:outer membrane protein TolC
MARARNISPGAVVAAVLLLMTGGAARAGAGGEVTLAGLEEEARRANPEIASAREAWRAATAAQGLETALPDPALAFRWWPGWGASEEPPDRYEVMLSQSFPPRGKRSAAGRRNVAAAHWARLELERTVRDTVRGVRESYHELRYLRRAREVAHANSGLLQRVIGAGETAYARGGASLNEVLRANAQKAQGEYDLVLLGELEAVETARLNALLGRPSESPVGPLAEEPFRPVTRSLEEVEALVLVHRQELLQAGLEEEKMRAEGEMARAEGRPEFMLGASYEFTQAAEGKDAEGMLGLQAGFTFPLWSGKNRSRREVAAAGLDRARAMKEAQTNETRTMLRENWYRLRNAQRLVALYRGQLLPEALRALSAAEARLGSGVGTIGELAEVQAFWYSAGLAEARAEADHGRALAWLEAQAGQRLGEREGSGVAPAAVGGAREALARELEKAARRAGEALEGGPTCFTPPAEALARVDRALEAEGADRLLEEGFTLEVLEALVLRRNPTVAAARDLYQAALATFTQAGSLNLLLETYGTFTGSLRTEAGGGMGRALRGGYPFPAVSSLRGEAARLEAAGAREELEIARRTALARTRTLFHQLVYNRRARELTRETLVYLEALKPAVDRRYETGEGRLADLTAVRAQVARMETEFRSLQEEERTLRLSLESLTGGVPVAGEPAVPDPGPPPPPLETLTAGAGISRQELKRMRIMLRTMDVMLEMGTLELYPGYSLGYSAAPAALPSLSAPGPMGGDGPPSSGGMAPQPRATFGLESGYLEELKERRRGLQRSLEAETLATTAMLRERWTAWDRAVREEVLYGGRLSELADLDASAAARRYAAGAETLGTAVEAALRRLEVSLELARRRADREIARASLEETAGTDLQTLVTGGCP